MNNDADKNLPAAPQDWLEALRCADAEVAAGRVIEVDIDALCREIEAEADAMEAARRGSGAASAA
jgi:hypothetical protein